MKPSNKIFLNLLSFVIAFSLGTIFSFLIYSYLFANYYIGVWETPASVVDFVCGDDSMCRGEKCRH